MVKIRLISLLICSLHVENNYPFFSTFLILSIILLWFLHPKKSIELILLISIILIFHGEIFSQYYYLIALLFYVEFFILEMLCITEEHLHIYSFFIFIFVFSALIYLRLIKERLPSDIIFDKNIFYLFLGLFAIIVHIFAIISLFKPIELTKFNLLINIIKWSYNSLYYIYNMLSAKYNIFGYILVKSSKTLVKYKHLKLYKYIYIFGYMMPRGVVALCFFLDVIIFNRFEMFYKGLFLLLLSICIKIFFELLRDYVELNLATLSNYINVAVINKTITITLKSHDHHFWEINQYKSHYMLLMDLFMMLTDLNVFFTTIQHKLFFSSINVIFIITWGYVLIKIMSSW